MCRNLQEIFKMANGHGGKRPGTGGKQPGAGRPKKEITDLRRRWQEKWLTEWVSDEDMQYLCQMTVGLAKRGDAAARADVFKYLLGNPPQPVEHSGDLNVTDVDARERLRGRIVGLTAAIDAGRVAGESQTG